MYETLSPRGEKYAEQALSRAIHATSLLPAAMVPREVLRDVADYREAESLDDALVLCLDWVGDGHC